MAFESGHVRPLALSPDGSRLYAVNTPDNRLEIFALSQSGMTHLDSVPVGLEPVSVACAADGRVWVVNHLSDSLSVIDTGSVPPRVERTLLVGDEPRDIVFAGPGHGRAFITTAHRGQNVPYDPQLNTPGIGRADVWVFDAAHLGDSTGGDPLTILTLFADTPRALAASPDGSTVYAAAFHSGNRTTIVPELAICEGGASAPPCEALDGIMPGGQPAPNRNIEGIEAPKTGLILRFNEESGAFEDELGRDWNDAAIFSLPDYDVFSIDAMADPPERIEAFAGAGTILFNMAINPVTGALYVTNTEANNAVRFEPNLRGELHRARITVIDPSGVQPRDLNGHIDYTQVPSPPGTAARSLATPLGLAVSPNGRTLYVAALGSDRVAVLDATSLAAGAFEPDPADHIPVSGGGPTGLALDAQRNRLYVFTRFDNGISVLDLEDSTEVLHVRLHNPEPREIVEGRRFLYDARMTSSNGEASCSACHVFADFDSLAWDLGDPDGFVLPNPNPVASEGDSGLPRDFHPMKGPMTTQTLRGLANHGPMHWRGDRTGGNDPGGDPFDERAAFHQFNPAFVSLLGRDHPLSRESMERFADFIFAIVPPPNPVRALDNSLTPGQAEGRSLFMPPDGECSGCHVLEPENGFFGTAGLIASNPMQASQFMKVPHLRNVYTKIGRFFAPGEQVRGFGLLHNGSGSLDVMGPRPVEFLPAFDSNLAPIVGQQITRIPGNETAEERIGLLIERSSQGECDLVATGVLDQRQRGWLREPGGDFLGDRGGIRSEEDLRRAYESADEPLTYLCVPPGSGRRIALDRDQDGFLNGEEIDAGTDPADAGSVPSPPISTATPLPTPTPMQSCGCPADCDCDAVVAIHELVRSVSLALTGGSGCALDSDGNRTITVDELVRGVRAALAGCP